MLVALPRACALRRDEHGVSRCARVPVGADWLSRLHLVRKLLLSDIYLSDSPVPGV